MAVSSRVDEAFEIPNPADRGTSRMQLLSLTQLVEDLCNTGGNIIDTNMMKLNPLGKKVSNANQGQPFRYGRWDGHNGNAALFFAEINMYDIVDNILKPMTKGPDSEGRFPSGCSYVEVMARTPQSPDLFVSHYFGQPFAILIGSLNVYVKRQAVARDICFWISSFAYRNWSKEQDLSSNIDTLPFMCALQCPTMKGTVLITSADCAAIQRVWCLFEINKSIHKRGHRLDIVIGAAGNTNVPIICTGDGASSGLEHVDSDTWDRLLNIQVSKAASSKYADKHYLTALIPGARDFDLAINQRIAQEALVAKSNEGDAHGIEKLLAFRIDVNYADPASKDGTALHRALRSSNLEAARVLVQSKANVNNQRNSQRKSPLHFADTQPLQKLLLTAGADPTLEDLSGLPAMAPLAAEGVLALTEKPAPEADGKPEQETKEQAEDSNDWPNTWVPYDNLLSVLAASGEAGNHMNDTIEVGEKISWKGSIKKAQSMQAD